MTAGPDQQPVGTAAPIRVLVVDDCPAVRTALADRLSDEGDLTVVGECEDGSQVVEAATRLSPDVVFMDLAMPVMDGLAATAALRDRALGTRVIMLTAEEGAARAGAAAAGAHAVVPKGTSFARLLHCLRTVTAEGEGCPFCL